MERATAVAAGTVVALVLIGGAVAHYERTRPERAARAAQQAFRDQAEAAARARRLAREREQREGPQLELIAQTARRDADGYLMRVRGQVRNITAADMPGVVAVVTWHDESGEFLTVERAAVLFQPIRAGEDSPFEVLTEADPRMAQYVVEFQRIGGGSIPTR